MSIFLAVWKGFQITEEDWAAQGEEILRTGSYDSSWSMGNRTSGITAGDKLFLVRQGKQPGIMSAGVITSEIERFPHWDEDLADEGVLQNYVDVSWLVQLDTDDQLPRELLEDRVPGVAWKRLQGSGVRVADEVEADLMATWGEWCSNLTFGAGGHDRPSLILDGGQVAPARVASTVQRIVRNSQLAYKVKRHHRFVCQLCDEALVLGSGAPYAEAAHIRPLGAPHDGSDTPDNMLCVCSNCHVRFDSGALAILDDGTLWDVLEDEEVWPINQTGGHQLDWDNVAYHRLHIAELED